MDIRHEIARNALSTLRWRSVPGAYHLWLELDYGWTSHALTAALQALGIAVTASEAFTVDGEPAPAAVRISLSSTPSVVDLRLGLEAVAQLAGAPQRKLAVRL